MHYRNKNTHLIWSPELALYHITIKACLYSKAVKVNSDGKQIGEDVIENCQVIAKVKVFG